MFLVCYPSFVCLRSSRKVFSGSTETDEDAQEVAQDVQGPSMREQMENERQVRMRAAADN